MSDYKIVDAEQLDSYLEAVADCLREKSGMTGKLAFPAEFIAAIGAIQTGGGGDVVVDTTIEDALLDGSLSGTYTNNRIKTIASQRLRGSNIVVFNSTSVETIESYGLYQSLKLEECNAPNLNNLSGGNAFNGCKALKRADFPKLSSVVASGTFTGCFALTYVNLGDATQIASSSINNTPNLRALVLPKTDGITALNHINALAGSAIANGTGFVYVPGIWVDTYKSATNWSTYSDQIKPLSELPEEYKYDS